MTENKKQEHTHCLKKKKCINTVKLVWSNLSLLLPPLSCFLGSRLPPLWWARQHLVYRSWLSPCCLSGPWCQDHYRSVISVQWDHQQEHTGSRTSPSRVHWVLISHLLIPQTPNEYLTLLVGGGGLLLHEWNSLSLFFPPSLSFFHHHPDKQWCGRSIKESPGHQTKNSCCCCFYYCFYCYVSPLKWGIINMMRNGAS